MGSHLIEFFNQKTIRPRTVEAFKRLKSLEITNYEAIYLTGRAITGDLYILRNKGLMQQYLNDNDFEDYHNLRVSKNYYIFQDREWFNIYWVLRCPKRKLKELILRVKLKCHYKYIFHLETAFRTWNNFLL